MSLHKTKLFFDCVIFGYDLKDLNILVLKWHGLDSWALPGGFIGKNEGLEK